MQSVSILYLRCVHCQWGYEYVLPYTGFNSLFEMPSWCFFFSSSAAARDVSILYLRCQANPPPWLCGRTCEFQFSIWDAHVVISRYYVSFIDNEFQFSIWDATKALGGRHRGRAVVSILYLRCVSQADIWTFLRRRRFQFSIWDAQDSDESGVEIRLQWFQFSIWDAAPPAPAAGTLFCVCFNSLFEMQ